MVEQRSQSEWPAVALKVAVAVAAAAGTAWCLSYLECLNQRIDAAADGQGAGDTDAGAEAGSAAVSESGASSDWVSVADDDLPDLEDVEPATAEGALGEAAPILNEARRSAEETHAPETASDAVHVTLLSTAHGDNSHVSVLIENITHVPAASAVAGDVEAVPGEAQRDGGLSPYDGGSAARPVATQPVSRASRRWQTLRAAVWNGALTAQVAANATAAWPCGHKCTRVRMPVSPTQLSSDVLSFASSRSGRSVAPHANGALQDTDVLSVGASSGSVSRSLSQGDMAAHLTRQSSCISFVSVPRCASDDGSAATPKTSTAPEADEPEPQDTDKPVYGLHSSVLLSAADSVEEPSGLDGPFVALGMTAAQQAHAGAAAESAEADRERLQELGAVDATVQPQVQRRTSSLWWGSLGSMWCRMHG